MVQIQRGHKGILIAIFTIILIILIDMMIIIIIPTPYI